MNDLDSLSSDGGGGGSSESGLKPGRALRRPFAPAVGVPAFGFGGAITRGQITPEEAKADASR